MEKIIKTFIINELQISEHYSDSVKKIIVSNSFKIKISTIFSITLDIVERIINEIMKHKYGNYELVFLDTIKDIESELEFITNSDENDFNYLLQFLNRVKELKTIEVRKQEYHNAARLRDFEKQIENLLN